MNCVRIFHEVSGSMPIHRYMDVTYGTDIFVSIIFMFLLFGFFVGACINRFVHNICFLLVIQIPFPAISVYLQDIV